MFADPAVVTINGVAHNLVRIRQDQYSSEYKLRSATKEVRLQVRNNVFLDKKRKVDMDQHNVELVEEIFPTTVGAPSIIRKAFLTFHNQKGDTLTDPANVVSGLLAFMTNANITRQMNFES